MQETFVNNINEGTFYESFKPVKLPCSSLLEISSDTLGLLLNANFLLGTLNGKMSIVKNKSLYQNYFVNKEALYSCQIEGMQTTIDDIFDPAIDENADLDKKDVINYIKAINAGNILLERLPLSLCFLKEVHKVLISDTRGSNKNPGEFRNSQNWIGPANSSIKNATFIPPNVLGMHEALSDLERYIHKEDELPALIKVALIHYQFETIHPFLDGNGRIGRLLIDFLLREYKLLNNHTMYMSYFLKRNRIEYYDRLSDVRRKGHYEAWINFFLKGIIESAKHSLITIDKLVALDNAHKNVIENSKGLKTTLYLLYDYIKENPIFSIKGAALAINKSYNTTLSATQKLIDLNIVTQRNDQMRNKTFSYEALLNILRAED